MYAFQNEQARPSLIPDTSNNVVYASFNEYIRDVVKDDVMDIFLPAFHNALKVNAQYIDIDPSRIEVKQVDPGKFNDRKHHVTVRFDVAGCNRDEAQDVTIMELPHVEPTGIIEYDSKHYAFIHMLEQEPAISFEANENTAKAQSIKIKNDARSFWIDDDARMLKIRFSDITGKTSKTKYTLIDLVAEFARYEGFDVEEVWNEFANFTIINMFKDEQVKSIHLYYGGGNTANVNASEYLEQIIPRLTLTRIKNNGLGDMSYNNQCVREDLNRLLSLDRAIGEELAQDVYSVLNPEALLYRAGEIVDQNMVLVMQANGVYCIYVKYIPNTEGYFLAETITIMSAPAGMKITKSIRYAFPEETGMYTSHDYDKLATPIIFEEGTPITDEIISVIVAKGYRSIRISEKSNCSDIKVLNFYEEVISNRQVPGDIIGKEHGKWYYLNVDNAWVENDGSYRTYDFVALQSFCVKLFDGKWINRVVNSDAGFRKRLVPLAEQYKRAFAYAVRKGFEQMNRKLKTVFNDSRGQRFLQRDLVDNEFYPFNKNFWKYLRDEAKCLVALQSDNVHNPVAYQSACTKVNVFTANKYSVADTQREIAIGSYGKIDPYEIPQSQKMGTVYNSTCDAKIHTDGRLTTGYYPVMRIGEELRIIFSKEIQMTAEEEEEYVMGDICSLQFDQNGKIYNTNDIVSCRVPANNSIEKHTFAVRRVSDIQFVNTCATQLLSWTSSTIPFMASNDAARAVFACAQMKQAKGLCTPDEPDVMTSAYEQMVWLNDKFGIIAKEDGRVDISDYQPREEKFFISVVYDSQDGVNNGTIYEFPEYFDSGYSVTKMRVLVKSGQRIRKGDMIACSNFISENGILTIGCNALAGYICDGYNYEDGAHISEAMCERLSSYRINREELTGSPRTTSEYHMDSYPIGRWIDHSEDMEVKVSYRDQEKSIRQKRNKILNKAYGFMESTAPIKSEHKNNNYGIEIQAVSVDKFNGGDKLSNRHGNKGVSSRIEPTANMPRLRNGMALDITHNPMGVGSRMNMGQIKEIHCGLFAHVLGFKLSADSYNSISEEEISALMSLTVDLMNSTGDVSGILQEYSNILEPEFLQHCADNIDKIRRYAWCFDKAGTTTVMLPDNEGRMTETKVVVGYIYVFKLIQEAHKKIHARGGETVGEPYGELTDAPTHGSAKGGGQRFGTMEMDALCAYGVPGYIHELTNERCDNAIARSNFYVDTFLPGKLREQYRIDSPGQRRSVTQFLYSLLALGVMAIPEDGEFIPLSASNGSELAHWKPSVIQRANTNYMKNYGSNKKEDNEVSEEDKQASYVQNARDLILGGSGD